MFGGEMDFSLSPELFIQSHIERRMLSLWPEDTPLTFQKLSEVSLTYIHKRAINKERNAVFYRYLALTAIVVILWLGAAGRFFAVGGVTFYEVIHHFTNWSWYLLQMPFYTSLWFIQTLRVIFDIGHEDWITKLQAIILFFGWTTVFGVTVFIYVAVFSNTNGIAHLFANNAGPDFTVGDLLLGNEIFHTLPIFFILVFSWFFAPMLRHAFVMIFAGVYEWYILVPLYLYLVYFGTIVWILMYFVIFDPYAVYQIDGGSLTTVVGLVVVFTILLVTIVPLTYFYTPIRITPLEWQMIKFHNERKAAQVDF